MTQIEIIDNPELDGTRRALVLTEDRVGHYPEFREFSSTSSLLMRKAFHGRSTCELLLE